MVELINEFKRNHLAKENVNIYDRDVAKDKFAKLEFDKLFRICCFKGN